ncbi:MAG TPA: ribosome maturation factor RimP [Nitrospirales bacterium]|nr:ribosome maturation factor RimP [Nitrospirales bacterium]
MAEPIVRALSLDLVDVHCAGQGPRTIVRVFIDKPGGVSVGDCEQVHVSLGHALDVEDPIRHPYILEVSSPGLDRPFRTRGQYVRAVGKGITVKLREPIDGQWKITGRLLETDDQGILLAPTGAAEAATRRLTWDAIAETRFEVTFS